MCAEEKGRGHGRELIMFRELESGQSALVSLADWCTCHDNTTREFVDDLIIPAASHVPIHMIGVVGWGVGGVGAELQPRKRAQSHNGPKPGAVARTASPDRKV